MDSAISDILRVTSNLSVVIPLAIYLTRMRNASKRLHIIGGLVMVSGICDLLGYIMFSQQQSTVILFNGYYAVIFFLLTWFYYEVLFASTRRLLVWIGLAIYIQSFILVTLFVQSFYEYQTLMWVITAIIMIIHSIAYFFYSLTSIQPANLFGYTFTWINTGVLVYFCLNLFLFILGNYVLTKLDPPVSMMIWSFHNVNNILKNILFAIGIYFYKNRKIADFA